MVERQAFESMWSDLAGVGRDSVRGGYSRHAFDDADLVLREWFAAEAGRRDLEVETDRNGNVWAWWGTPGPDALVTGSHLDSVPGGGAFDGPLGVASALLAVDELRARGITPTRPVALVCFAEEEGGRFGLPCLGSRLLSGATDPDTARALRDPDGTTVAEAARRAGIDPDRMGPDPERLARIGALVELHVEQGRLLHAADPDARVAVGTGIVAHGRWRLTITGQGNHAGTTAIGDRRDPMVVAAQAVLAARDAARGHDGAVATVGRMVPNPGGTNVIASSVRLWLDTRYGAAADTAAVVDRIVARVRQLAQNEGCTVEVAQESASPAVTFDAALRDAMAATLGAPEIPTGAGHDAGVLGAHVPTGMLFVRNPTGISHAPGEHAETDDCLAGVSALADVLAGLCVADEMPAEAS
jgi:N-carbamoyl-L-amino-acid hydrolase